MTTPLVNHPTESVQPIHSLLIANRGEIARRVIRSARAMGITTVAVYSDADRDLPHVDEADLAVRLPGLTPGETYLRADLIVDAALRAGADAVHPGYGFLSENADFAAACAAADLTFVGPSPHAIRSMGSKLASKALMERAGVPVLPSYEVTGAETADELAAAGARVGYPVLVKASAGGGGRGMRVVHDSVALADAVDGARREAASAFGDGTVFLERYVESSRHVEIQVLGDTHGRVVGLFERECSIQRRHQKIIEEAPSPAVGADLRKRMIEAAVTAAEAISYVGAGTVEFLLTHSGEFFFLEMNTRLQVEHPVTELITGVDLVRAQLEIATGRPLSAEITGAEITGHAIEARLYAEDPAADWRPATGTLECFDLVDARVDGARVDGVRVDSGFVAGNVVGTHYDPMLAKVIAWGPDRAEASRRLAAALRRARIHGVTTNRDLLIAILAHPEFASGDTDTHFLVRNAPGDLQQAAAHPDLVRTHVAAATLALLARGHAAAPVTRHAPIGWSNGVMPAFRQEFSLADRTVAATARWTRTGVTLTVGGEAFSSPVRHHGPDRVELEIDGVRHIVEVHPHGHLIETGSALGMLTLREVARLPEPGAFVAAGSLLAPMPGAVVRVLAAVGDSVIAGQPLVVLEAMKMEHLITAPTDGVVAEIQAREGSQVDTGTVLAVVDEGAE